MAQHVGIRILEYTDLEWSGGDVTPANVAGSLPAFDDLRYPLLRTIDPYGDTIFSSYQMPGLIEELRARLAETGDASLTEAIAAGERCNARPGTWLVFVGD